MTSAIARASELHQAGRLNEAVAIYNQILAKNPKHVDALHLLGVVAFQAGDYAQSEQLIATALRLNPALAAVNHNMGTTQRVLGNLDNARRYYRKAIDLQHNYAEAYFNLSAIVRFENQQPEFICAIEKLIARSKTSRSDRCFLHFAAGKYHDDLQQYDQAFEHFRQGNECSDAAFDIAAYKAMVDAIIDTIGNDFYRQRKIFGVNDQTPVFIVGMPRSGTTLVEQILSSHPDIVGAGELADIPGITAAFAARAADQTPYPKCLLTASKEDYGGFGAAYVNRLRSLANGALRVIDKNLLNHQHLGLIMTMLPQAKVIHCSRDALDTGLSCYFQKFKRGQDFSYSFAGIAAYYRGYQKLMAHWQSIAAQRIIDLPYESVVNDLPGKARELFEFLELPWHDDCLAFHKNKRAVATASDAQVRQPIYTSSVRRSEHYAKHLEELEQLLEP